MNFSLVVFLTLSCGLLVGFIPTLIDSLNKPWQTRLNFPADRVDWAYRLFYGCWLPAMPLTGWVLDRWSTTGTLYLSLFIGLIGLITSLAWLAMVRNLNTLLANMLLVGISYSVVTTCSVYLMTIAFFPQPGATASFNYAAFNLGFIPVAIGALLGPFVVQLLERWWGYRQGLLYLSLACIVPAVMTVLCERDELPVPQPSELLVDDFVHPHIVLVVIVILLYFGLENCLEFWPEPYLKELGYESRGLQWSLLMFWFAFVGSRAAAAWWFYEHPTHAAGVTLILVILSALVMGNLVGGYNIGSSSWGFWLVGVCYGPLLPGFLGLALDHRSTDNPNPSPAMTLGILLSVSGLDTLIVRPFMHRFVVNRAARSVMRVPTLLALLLAVPLLILVLLRN